MQNINNAACFVKRIMTLSLSVSFAVIYFLKYFIIIFTQSAFRRQWIQISVDAGETL